MASKGKNAPQQDLAPKKTPAFLREDYPYKTIGEEISDPELLADGELYELKCPQCQMSIRSQGKNIKETYRRFLEGSGCLGCGNKALILQKVDIKKPADSDAK